MKQLTISYLTGALLALSSLPVTAKDLAPEVVSRVWQSDSTEYASVCLNGKELCVFHGDISDGSASDKADELAIKLNDLLVDKSFDANALIPGKDGNLSVVKLSANPVLSFEAMPSTSQASPLETSLRTVNAIRLACNVPTLPSSLLKLSENFDSSGKGICLGSLSATAATGAAAARFSGPASWYGGRFHGRRTSDGSRYDQEKMTAAHRSLPFGTQLLVMNRKTGQICVVKVNDRGPFIGNRVIDLSRRAARELKMLSSGVAMVDCLVLGNTNNQQ